MKQLLCEIKRKLIGVLMLSLAAGLCPFAANAEIPMTKKSLPVSVEALHPNGDGNLFGWSRTADGVSCYIFDKDLNLIKMFSLKTYETLTPVSIHFEDGPGRISSFYATKHVFNDDDMWEVKLSNGDVYNENGFYVGRIEGSKFQRPDGDHSYVTASGELSSIEEADMSEAWLIKYDSELNGWLREALQVLLYGHCDFGLPSTLMHIEAAGTDNFGTDSGYNWFKETESYRHQSGSTSSAYMIYYYPNETIRRINVILSQVGNGSDDASKLMRSQCYALRAYLNHIMVQCAQHTYVGHEDAPGIAKVDETNFMSAPTDGVRRSNLRDSDAFILSDLDKSIALLTEKNIDSYASIDPDMRKCLIDAATAYGLRARVKLVMCDWPGAASDAKAALSLTDATPVTIAEAQVPGFEDMRSSSWMWGLCYKPTDRAITSGIVNFHSHFSPFSTYGYFGVSPRFANHSMVDTIPATDVRHRWYLNGDGDVSELPEEYAAFLEQQTDTEGYSYGNRYIPVKFGPKNGLNNPVQGDYPLFRVEELYYIYAEALAMQGSVDEAKSFLTAFEKEYRNPSFTSDDITTGKELQEKIWNLRRIEFWGEGLSYFDLMRLKKGVDRVGSGCPAKNCFVIEDGNPLLIWPIPEACRTQNALLLEDNREQDPEPPFPAVSQSGTLFWMNQLLSKLMGGRILFIRTYNGDKATNADYQYRLSLRQSGSDEEFMYILYASNGNYVIPEQTVKGFFSDGACTVSSAPGKVLDADLYPCTITYWGQIYETVLLVDNGGKYIANITVNGKKSEVTEHEKGSSLKIAVTPSTKKDGLSTKYYVSETSLDNYVRAIVNGEVDATTITEAVEYDYMPSEDADRIYVYCVQFYNDKPISCNEFMTNLFVPFSFSFEPEDGNGWTLSQECYGTYVYDTLYKGQETAYSELWQNKSDSDEGIIRFNGTLTQHILLDRKERTLTYMTTSCDYLEDNGEPLAYAVFDISTVKQLLGEDSVTGEPSRYNEQDKCLELSVCLALVDKNGKIKAIGTPATEKLYVDFDPFDTSATAAGFDCAPEAKSVDNPVDLTKINLDKVKFTFIK